MGSGMKRLYEMGYDETQEFVVASGPRTNPMHIDFTDRAVGPNEPVIVDINGASYMGYALGHGLGLSLHESPIMFFDQKRAGPNTTFKEGMVLAVETWAGRRVGNFGVRSIVINIII